MTEMIVVEDRNQDDMSRKAGCYLYTDTRLWLENDQVHRVDGPAVISPDGVVRWYIPRRQYVLHPEQMADTARTGYGGKESLVPGSIPQMNAFPNQRLGVHGGSARGISAIARHAPQAAFAGLSALNASTAVLVSRNTPRPPASGW